MSLSSFSFYSLLAAAGLSVLSSCTHGLYARDTRPRAVVKDGVVVTVCDQKLTMFRNGQKVTDYDISTSKFGLGSTNGSKRTPLGIHAVSQKTGEGQPKGMVFKGARPTGEVVEADAPGRDPVVTRVIQLAGLEAGNSNTHSRRIYIHGTPEERKIGRPASYGCIRMKSDDVVDLFNRVHRGMPVVIESCTQKTYMEAEQDSAMHVIRVPDSIVAKLPVDTKYRLRATGRRITSSRLAAARKTQSSKSKNGKKVSTTGKKQLKSRNVSGKKLASKKKKR